MNHQHRDWMEELGESLQGPRRAKQRLVNELNAHIEDAVAAELANGLTPEQAETEALARIGSASELANRWSTDTSTRRRTGRARVLALSLVIAAVVAPVGLAQRSGSKPSTQTGSHPRTSEVRTLPAEQTETRAQTHGHPWAQLTSPHPASFSKVYSEAGEKGMVGGRIPTLLLRR